MTTQQIKAIGFFLAWYESDLAYLANFKRFLYEPKTIIEYSTKGNHTFYNFLSEFRIARNIKKGNTQKLLMITLQWLKTQKVNNPDLFAVELRNKGLTHNKIMTSLASKILFLNNPQEILPIDNRVRQSVSQNSNLYIDYIPLVNRFKIARQNEFKECLIFIEESASLIEKPFIKELTNIKAIRRNRMLDKLLWSIKGDMI